MSEIQNLEHKIQNIITGLMDPGYIVLDSLFGPEQIQQLLDQAKELHAMNHLIKAKIGSSQESKTISEIRGDYIYWIQDWSLPILASYKNFIDQLMLKVHSDLFVSCKSFDAHFAYYPKDSFYLSHYDQHRINSPSQLATVAIRQISCILYLSPWQQDYEGHLKLYTGTDQAEFIAPTPGRFVCFRSADFLHEVLPTKNERWAVTGWLKDKN